MPRPRIFVARRLPGDAITLLRKHARVDVWEDELPPSAEALRERASGCDGMLSLLTDRIEAGLLDAAPNLLAISNMATGFDNVDIEAASARLVLVTRTPGVLAETTADFAFALLLAGARRVVEGDRYTRAGRWQTWGPETLLGHDVHGATIGIVGMGGIGQEVAKRARGFGMRILYTSRTRKASLERRNRVEFAELDRLLRESDFVTLHAPLTPETHGMIGARELRRMKKTAVLVNTGRGQLVDQEALERALREGWIARAALDVTDPEPMPADHPLLNLDNVVVTPHMASASVATRSRMAMLAAEQLLQALQGKLPKHTMNRDIAKRWRKRVREQMGLE